MIYKIRVSERIAMWLLKKTHYFNVKTGDFTRYK